MATSVGVLVIDWLILWNMSYHRLARISRETDGVADVIYHAVENYMQAQDPRVNLKLFYYYVFFFIV